MDAAPTGQIGYINATDPFYYLYSMKYTLLLLLLAVSSLSYAQREVPSSESVQITGAVKNSVTYTINDILKFKQTDLGDVSINNHKGDVKYVAHNVKGVLVKSLLDSVKFSIAKPKELSQMILVFEASDGYKTVYSWNEIFNSETGNNIYILTEKDGKSLPVMNERIQVLSTTDINMGMRRMRGLAKIEIRKID